MLYSSSCLVRCYTGTPPMRWLAPWRHLCCMPRRPLRHPAWLPRGTRILLAMVPLGTSQTPRAALSATAPPALTRPQSAAEVSTLKESELWDINEICTWSFAWHCLQFSQKILAELARNGSLLLACGMLQVLTCCFTFWSACLPCKVMPHC